MIGKIISHYRIIEKLGGGGMGVVYKAQDTKLDRQVALKFLPPQFSLDEEIKQRFIHEAKSASSLDHYNICTIYEIGETEDEQLFIVMAYYEGETLKKKIEREPLKIEEAIDIAIQISEGLSQAHEKKIVHRDIKPDNILITNDGVVKILDFGLAKVSGQTQLTQMGSTVGTVAYMSPEQTRGEVVDHRTDIWSIGVVLYEMIKGEKPFKGDYEQAVIYSILNEEPQLLSVSDDLPSELFDIITKALSKNPENRYQTIGNLLSDFKNYGFIDYGHETHYRLKFLKNNITKWKYYLFGVFILLLITIFYLIYPSGTDSRYFGSLVVLPFENYTGNEDLEYFVSGMHSSLIGDIGKISNLRVISKTTSNVYKNIEKSIPEIASELGVEAVIEASVLSLGDSVHLQVKLVDAFPEEKQLWIQDFHVEKSQIINLYHRITKQISDGNNIILTPLEEQLLADTGPVDPEAYKTYLLGMYHLNKLTPESKEKGLEYLHEAIRIAPDEPFAYAGLALGYLEIGHGPLASEDVRSKAEANALQAIKLDPNMAEANSALAEIYLYFHWEFELAEEYFLKALKLNPNLALTHYHYSWALYLFGHMEEAIVHHKLAQKYDPLNPKHTAWLGALYYYDGQYEEAIRVAFESFELQKDYAVGYYILGLAYLEIGRIDEATEAHKKLAELNPWWTYPLCLTYSKTGQIDKAEQLLKEMENTKATPWTAFSRIVMYSALQKLDEAFEWLEYEPHHAFTAWAAVQPDFKNMHSDPRFNDFVTKLNIPK